MEPFLPYGRQVIGDDDVEAVAEALRSDMLTTGPRVEAFEAALRDLTGAKHAIACATGTAALHLAALGLKIGDGDQVIVPTITFAATASSVRLCGGDVVFADVDPDSGQTTPALIAEAVARADAARLKAVFPVDLRGSAIDRGAVAKVTEGLPLVFDACHALGGRDPAGVRVGGAERCLAETFSFHPVKMIAMGEGGAVTTNDDAFAKKVRHFRNHGIERDPTRWRNADMAFDPQGDPNPWYYELHDPSVNYRVTDIQCALGLSQLRKLDTFARARAAVRVVYDRLLPALAPVVTVPPSIPAAVLHLYAVNIDFEAVGKSRAQVMGELRELGVGTQVHYIPLHRQPYFAERHGAELLPGADAYYARTLSIPFFAGMSEEDALRAVSALSTVLGLPDPTR
jgi:dTDP-4-amino-4,6-dideoxygalactose transaminase